MSNAIIRRLGRVYARSVAEARDAATDAAHCMRLDPRFRADATEFMQIAVEAGLEALAVRDEIRRQAGWRPTFHRWR